MSIKNKSNSFIISIQMEICGYIHIMEEQIMISKREIQESFQYSKKSRNKLNFLMEIKTMEILSNSSERRLEETWTTGFQLHTISHPLQLSLEMKINTLGSGPLKIDPLPSASVKKIPIGLSILTKRWVTKSTYKLLIISKILKQSKQHCSLISQIKV